MYEQHAAESRLIGDTMSRRIGFSSHCFPKDYSIETILNFCEKHEFNAMELNVNKQNFEISKINDSTLKRIKTLVDSDRIRFSLHPSENINFSDTDECKRMASIEKIVEVIRFASEVGIQKVVVHPGELDEDNTEYFGKGVSHTISGIQHCAMIAKSSGVKLSVENLCHVKGTVAPDINSFYKLCENIGLSLIGITLDTGHAALVDGLAESLSVIEKYVDHVHIDDNSDQKSNHLELGKGQINFQSISKFLRTFEEIINIELKIHSTDYEGPILRSRQYLLNLLDHDM